MSGVYKQGLYKLGPFLGIYKTDAGDGSDLYYDIGGRTYRCVKIGNQIWMAENLDYRFTGLVVGAEGTSEEEMRGNYYNNDESTYGVNGNKYGLLYNGIAVSHLLSNRSQLFPGWHVSSRADWTELLNFIGENPATKLKAKNVWSSGDATDDYGFAAMPAGQYTGSFEKVGSNTWFWTDRVSGLSGNVREFASSSSSTTLKYKSGSFSVRLVKDE